jgi:hypothetical protein
MLQNGFGGAVGVASYLDSGTAVVNYGLSVAMSAGASTFLLVTPGGANMSATAPITWANLDEIYAFFSYEI